MRLLLIASLFFGFTFSNLAQNILIFDEYGVDVTGSAVNVSFTDTNTSPWFYIHTQFKVVNNTGASLDLKGKRIEIVDLVGAKHALEFCVLHYVPKFFGVEPVYPQVGSVEYMDFCTANAGDTIHLGSEVFPDGNVGTACIKYIVFDGNNPSDSSYVDLCLDIVAGVEEQRLEISAYPNPVDDVLTVSLAQTGNFNYQIIDVIGNLVQSGVSDNRIHVTSLVAGTYFVRIEKDGETGTSKFVKH